MFHLAHVYGGRSANASPSGGRMSLHGEWEHDAPAPICDVPLMVDGAMDRVQPGCMQLGTGGLAFFISDRLAVTSLGCVPRDWRQRPEVQLLRRTGALHVPSWVVAENQELEIALLEIHTPVPGI